MLQETSHTEDVRSRLLSALHHSRSLRHHVETSPRENIEHLNMLNAKKIEAITQIGTPLDVVVSATEINTRHGTGILMKRMFGGWPNLVTIRTLNIYNEHEEIGLADFIIGNSKPSRPEIFRIVQDWLGRANIRRVVCVPFYAEDLIAATAISRIYDAPLCIFVMDDNNLLKGGIPNAVMKEALECARLRFAISPELQRAYETKYRVKFHILPPIVASKIIAPEPLSLTPDTEMSRRGVLFGNIWSQDWLDSLRGAIKGTDIKIDWYSNNENPSWLNFDAEELRRDGITLRKPVSEPELIQIIKQHGFCLLPSSQTDEDGTGSHNIGTYSLPSRLPLTVAAAHTPTLVLGSEMNAASRFVARFDVGLVSTYDKQAIRDAITQLCDPEVQHRMRQNAFSIGHHFSSKGIAKWVWDSLDAGKPVDDRFDALMPLQEGEFAYYLDGDVPESIIKDFEECYRALRRLTAGGYRADFVVDVGASSGIWSHQMADLFPEARFVLLEPLLTHYDKKSNGSIADMHDNFEAHEIALSDKTGDVEFLVSKDLYNSSALHVGLTEVHAKINVRGMTLDDFAGENKLTGRGVLKVDVQHTEHLVLEGGRDFIANHIDAIVLELTLERPHPDALDYLEMVARLDQLGFVYADEAGEWRSPATGRLEQKDVLFIRKGLV